MRHPRRASRRLPTARQGRPEPGAPVRRRPPDGRVVRVRDLSAIVKAYDVRGVVPDQLDERGRPGDRRRLRRASTGAPRRGRDRARHAARRRPRWRRAFAEGATAQGADVIDAGLGSTDLLYFASGCARPARRDVHRQPQPGAVQRHQAVPGRRRAGRPGHRPARDPRRWPSRTLAAAPARRGHASSSATCSPAYADAPARPGRPDRHPAAEGRRRRRQRDGRPHRAGRARRRPAAGRPSSRCTSSSTAPSPTTRPTRWTRPTCVDLQARVREDGADLGLAFDGDADRCFVVDERGEPVSPVRDHRAGRRPRAGQATRARRSSTT